MFHQDPRYFYKGTGTIRSRALYAIKSAFICRGDNGKPEFDFSHIGGDFAAAGLSNLYYPEPNEGATLIFTNGLIEIGGMAGTNLIREFVLRGITSHVPAPYSGPPVSHSAGARLCKSHQQPRLRERATPTDIAIPAIARSLSDLHTTRAVERFADRSTDDPEEKLMYHHVKKLMYTVRIGEPDPRFGRMLLEQFGGANGELAAAMQYSIQGLNCEDEARKDLLMDIGTEELSHLEIVGALIRMHLKPMKESREAADADPLVAIAGGGGVALQDSVGNAWTANYLKVTGDLAVDLRSNVAAEARAKIVYERLMGFTQDQGSRQALQFLMTREITHMRAFSAAIESMEKPPFSIGIFQPTPKLVDEFVNASTGEGEEGRDMEGQPWNSANGLHIVRAKAEGAWGCTWSRTIRSREPKKPLPQIRRQWANIWMARGRSGLPIPRSGTGRHRRQGRAGARKSARTSIRQDHDRLLRHVSILQGAQPRCFRLRLRARYPGSSHPAHCPR